MITRVLMSVLFVSLLAVLPLRGQEKPPFSPEFFWSNSGNKGAIVVSETEIVIVGPGGERLGKIMTAALAFDVYVSPDGEKVAYMTSGGLWLATLKTKQNYRVSEARCGALHWNNDSLSFMFVASTMEGNNTITKLFWADGEGKNLKQVYP